MHPDLTDKATSAAALWHSIPVAHRQATLQGRRCSPPPPAQVHTMTHLLLSQSRHSPHHALFQRLGLAWAVPAASSTPAARCEHPAPAGQCGAVPAIAAAAPGSSRAVRCSASNRCSSTWQQHLAAAPLDDRHRAAPIHCLGNHKRVCTLITSAPPPRGVREHTQPPQTCPWRPPGCHRLLAGSHAQPLQDTAGDVLRAEPLVQQLRHGAHAAQVLLQLLQCLL
jgi:hypothetical protein